MSIPSDLILQQITVGPMENFSYFIGDAKTKEIAIVDPGWDGGELLRSAEKAGLVPVAILLTHGHYDHINGIGDIQDILDIPVYLSVHESDFHVPDCRNLKRTKPGEIITVGRQKIECIHTPGHSKGCQCFRCRNILLTGDTLFVNGCGRCDLPGGDPLEMYHTLYRVLLPLPDETVIYPGHAYGPKDSDTLGRQKKTNPYLLCSSKEDFLHNRMG